MIVHLGIHMNGRRGVRGIEVGVDKGAEWSHTDSSRLDEPRVTIDAGTLIEPAFFERSVGSYTNKILTAIVYIFGHIIHLRGIAAGFGTHIEAVEPYAGIAEDAVKLQGNVLAQVRLGDCDHLAIPTHTRFGIFITNSFVAVRVAGLLSIGQGSHPIVRNAHLLPCRVVKLDGVRALVVY